MSSLLEMPDVVMKLVLGKLDYVSVNFEVSSFVPKDICETLQTKGLHTLQELEKKNDFNATLEIPASPSFLGISLLDVLKGNYRIKISIASEGKKIVEFALPTGYKDLKMGMSESDDED
ncbi:hypothetical protein L5515_013303 [Caenorhabditis briggsae]|uniref:Uncharacterized protein n=1 Tax=Caenorhabditis briggsae TaxID=6238 RepID=A0AAE9EA92_CAEBR|nr:hypothetical protein L5515_013303 [Caenorhabditis briggsae]